MEKKQYGLPTAIAMIVGIVIGSGIFFKSDDILVHTNGNIALGVVVFCLAAISIIFGSLTIAELAARNAKPGGIIAYAEETCNQYVACGFGWFHTFLYYPTLIVVVAWVVGIYTTQLFNLPNTTPLTIGIGMSVMIALFACNILSTRLGGYFQNAATVIKLIPLFIMAGLGLCFGDPSTIDAGSLAQLKSATWIGALAPIAFSFDGWIVSTSISSEIKNPKKNVPLALIIAPLFILALYILYFVGISIYLGPEQVMQLGDEHVYVAANNLFGSFGGKLMLVFVLISVMGTVNGLVLGMIRLPYSLAIRGMFPHAKKMGTIDERFGISLRSAGVALAICIFWGIVHFITLTTGALPNSDISEISITINYVLYIVLYVKVFQLGLSGEIKGMWRGRINPTLAVLGSLMILSGSSANPMFWFYVLLCCLVL